MQNASLPLREAAGGGVKETKVRGNVIPVAIIAYCKQEGYKSASYVQRNETWCSDINSAKLRKSINPAKKIQTLFPDNGYAQRESASVFVSPNHSFREWFHLAFNFNST